MTEGLKQDAHSLIHLKLKLAKKQFDTIKKCKEISELQANIKLFDKCMKKNKKYQLNSNVERDVFDTINKTEKELHIISGATGKISFGRTVIFTLNYPRIAREKKCYVKTVW